MPATLNAYVSDVAEAESILDDYGEPATWAALTSDEKIVLLNQGSRYIDGVYGRYARGYKSSCTQALMWPRKNVYIEDGCEIDSSTVPDAVKIASVLAAAEAARGVIELFPVATAQERSLKREVAQIGPLKVEEEWTGAGASSNAPPKLSIVDALIRASGLFNFQLGREVLRG